MLRAEAKRGFTPASRPHIYATTATGPAINESTGAALVVPSLAQFLSSDPDAATLN